jgi:hypothetical protein
MATYKIIGADTREYGPVSFEQLSQWITEGRANAYTKVLVEGESEWKSLSQVAEFAQAFGSAPSAAPPSPTTPPPATMSKSAADALAAEIIARDYQLNIAHCLSRAWELVTTRFWLSIGVTALIVLLAIVAGCVPIVGPLMLTYVLYSGLDWFFLKMIRGEQAELADAFVGFGPLFLPLMLFSVVGQLLTGIGFLFCLIPGIYLTVAWMMFAGLLILDKKLEFWDAMEVSRRVVTHHWWKAFGLLLVCVLLVLAGLLVCGIGVFVAYPVVTAAVVFAYEDIFGSRTLAPSGPVQPTAPATVPGPTT